MSGSVGLQNRECRESVNWVQTVLSNIKSVLFGVAGSELRSVPAVSIDAELVEQMYELAVASEFRQFRKLSQSIKNEIIWTNHIQAVVERIERFWLADDITLLQTIDAFWTVHRTLDGRKGQTSTGQVNFTNSAACVAIYVPSEEHHSFGAQLLLDQLNSHGFDVVPLFQRTANDMFDVVSERHIDVLAVSIGYDLSLAGLADTISEARLVSANPRMAVIVGGCAINGADESYDFLNADKVVAKSEDALWHITSAVPTRTQKGHHGHA